MKVCFITPNVFPVPATKGGACETLVNNLIDENEKQKKLSIICVSVFEEEAYKLSKQYKYTDFIYIKNEKDLRNVDLSYASTDNSFISYMDAIYEKIKDLDIDLIIIEGGDMEGYNYLLKRFPKNKCVAHLHGNSEPTELLSDTYQNFITVSNFVANKLAKDSIISKDRIHAVYNGIYTEKFDKSISNDEKIELRKKYNISENENVIVFCGRTVPTKGIKELILAFKNSKYLDNSKLLIVGNSNFAKEVETDYDRELKEISSSIPDKIAFTGFIDNNDLYKIHNISDIAVVPTLNEEAFGLVVVEFLASGLPLIATVSGAIPEIVDEESAILIKKDDSMINNLTKSIDYLIENKNVRESMSRHGKVVAEKYSVNNFYNNFINAISKMSN